MLPMHHLVGAHELEKLLGVSRQRVHQLTRRSDFPAPVAVLGMGKVWHTEDVLAWEKSRIKEGRKRRADG